jgi:flagellar motility protein MotE (MotC chaperone)
MGQRGRTFRSPFFTILVLSVLLMKLLLAAQNLFTPSEASGPFAVPEALAKDQKKDAPPPAGKNSADKPQPQAEPAKTTPPPTANPVEMTAYLQQKEAELKRKEQHLQEQEQYLQQMQKDIEQRLQELIAIQKDIQTYRNERTESRSANIRSLAQIYGSMKPKEAAKLFGDMDEKLVVSVISTMKVNEAAEILSAMDSKKAAKISEALTKR